MGGSSPSRTPKDNTHRHSLGELFLLCHLHTLQHGGTDHANDASDLCGLARLEKSRLRADAPNVGKYLPTVHLAQIVWVFPKIGVPQNGWFIMENPIKSIKMDDLGVPFFLETPVW